MTAVTPHVPEHAALPPMASRFVRTAAVPWQTSRYPGIETKTLLVDPSTGQLTMLMRMSAGARLPDHEHVLIEQTYVLEGRLACAEGECAAGDFVWRPAGSRHEAWAGAEGCLLLGVFQMPNRFFEVDGREADFSGQDWASRWGEAYERQARAWFDR